MDWKEQLDDEGRSFVEFLREDADQIITCVACSKQICKKEDFDVVEKIYTHTRTIEHGFKLFVMMNVDMETIDLTICDSHENDRSDKMYQENWSPNKPKKAVEITRNTNGTLQISGSNPIKYVIPIVHLPFMKTKAYECQTSRRTVLSSLDNYFTKESSPSKRKQCEREADSSDQNSSASSDRVTSPKKRKTSQLTLERWVKNDEGKTLDLSESTTSPQKMQQQQVDQSVSTSSPQKMQQQEVHSVAQISSEGLTRVNEVRPTKRGISQIIRARVTIKSDIHPFFNFLGPTTMFSLDLIDESGEIRLSAYGENVNKFYDLVEVDRIYYFSKFRVKATDQSKSPVISDYNITLNEHSIIRPCVLVPLHIPKMSFNFQPISIVEEMKKDDIVDVIAICESYDEVEHKRLSNGSPGRSRAIWLVDKSLRKILLYIWGTNADNFNSNRPGDVIALKRAKVKTYAKLNLDSSCLSSSTFQINPKMPEADDLRKWYGQKGNIALKVLSSVPRPRKVSKKN